MTCTRSYGRTITSQLVKTGDDLESCELVSSEVTRGGSNRPISGPLLLAFNSTLLPRHCRYFPVTMEIPYRCISIPERLSGIPNSGRTTIFVLIGGREG